MLDQPFRLGYRGDIEGLRAVAILLVVAAHAHVPWLAGGFVGVDVFFVLSGYLITGLLLHELDTTGTIRFANFYARRFRRLLPALLLMLIVTCIVAAILLPPGAQPPQASAAASAAIWLSNFYFAFSKLDYFGADAARNLFLHTWSLGVEEQFYLVWPALLVLLTGSARLFRRSAGVTRLKIAMFAISGVGVLACVRITETSPQMAFYLMPLRAWQFALGALTLLYFRAPLGGERGPQILRACGWLGLGLIISAAMLLDANTLYPGMAAVMPSLGAAFVLAAGSAGAAKGVARPLSLQPLQAIGRVSYAWYLWHWPVLLLGAAIGFTSPWQRAALVALSLALAVVSYAFVESPVRHNARLLKRPGWFVGGAVALMVGANLAGISWFNAVLKWLDAPQQQRAMAAQHDLPAIYPMGCDDFYRSADVRVCAFGASDAAHTAVLMGDSIGGQWFPAVAKAFDRPDWRVLVLTKSSCPMVDEPVFNRRIGRNYTECTKWRADALKQVAALHADIVILGSSPTYDFNQTQWVDGTTRVLKAINTSAGRVYLLRGTPGLPFDGPACLSARNWLPALSLVSHTCKAPAYNQTNSDVFQSLQNAARGFGNVSVLDMNDLVCPSGECQAERGGAPVYRDEQHLTATFVESLGDAMRTRIGMDQ